MPPTVSLRLRLDCTGEPERAGDVVKIPIEAVLLGAGAGLRF